MLPCHRGVSAPDTQREAKGKRGSQEDKWKGLHSVLVPGGCVPLGRCPDWAGRRHREAASLFQGHTAHTWQSKDLNPGSLAHVTTCPAPYITLPLGAGGGSLFPVKSRFHRGGGKLTAGPARVRASPTEEEQRPGPESWVRRQRGSVDNVIFLLCFVWRCFPGTRRCLCSHHKMALQSSVFVCFPPYNMTRLHGSML